MTTWAISVHVPVGESPAEQQEALLTALEPFLVGLSQRPPSRAGNVMSFDVLSAGGIRQADTYLLVFTVDNPSARALRRLSRELGEVLPAGCTVSVLGEFSSVVQSAQVLAW